MTLEDQLELISLVMADRSIPSRPGPMRQRLKELGLDLDNCQIKTLMNHWRYQRSKEIYLKDQPRW